MRGAVLALRAQPLERIDHPIVVSGRRGGQRFGRRAVARVAAVVAAVVGVDRRAQHPGRQGARPRTRSGAVPAASSRPTTRTCKQLRALRVLQLGGRPPRGTGVGSFGR